MQTHGSRFQSPGYKIKPKLTSWSPVERLLKNLLRWIFFFSVDWSPEVGKKNKNKTKQTEDFILGMCSVPVEWLIVSCFQPQPLFFCLNR